MKPILLIMAGLATLAGCAAPQSQKGPERWGVAQENGQYVLCGAPSCPKRTPKRIAVPVPEVRSMPTPIRAVAEPSMAKVARQPERIVKRFSVLFGDGLSTLDQDATSTLGIARKEIRKTSRVSVTGHTDGKGTAEANKRLALRRAEKVRDALLSKGVGSSQIELAVGPPCCTGRKNASPPDRRVDVVVLTETFETNDESSRK